MTSLLLETYSTYYTYVYEGCVLCLCYIHVLHGFWGLSVLQLRSTTSLTKVGNITKLSLRTSSIIITIINKLSAVGRPLLNIYLQLAWSVEACVHVDLLPLSRSSVHLFGRRPYHPPTMNYFQCSIKYLFHSGTLGANARARAGFSWGP